MSHSAQAFDKSTTGLFSLAPIAKTRGQSTFLSYQHTQGLAHGPAHTARACHGPGPRTTQAHHPHHRMADIGADDANDAGDAAFPMKGREEIKDMWMEFHRWNVWKTDGRWKKVESWNFMED